MAERIVSPGVFTQERDQTFLAQGVAEIGAAFVGPTTKGPAFVATPVQGLDGFVTSFGEPDGTSYMGYTVKNYLQEAGSATIVRVLGLAGYTTNVATIFASGSAGNKVFAVLHPTVSGSSLSSVVVGGTTSSFSVVVSSSANIHYSASVVSPTETNSSFINEVFGTDAQGKSSTIPAYVYAVFPDALSQVGSFAGELIHFSSSINALNLATQYDNATTPWIRSQTIGGSKRNLFKVHTLSDGTGANKQIKISITGISPSTNPDSQYGSFTLNVREFTDTDTSPVVVEQFNNLNFDPTSPNYIARVIGNSVPTYNSSTGLTTYEGDYPNLSKYIRIEMSEDVIPQNAVPYGFAALNSVFSSTAGEVPLQAYVNSRWVSASVAGYNADATGPNTNYYGFNFDGTYVSGSGFTAESYLAPTVGSNTVGGEFSIENLPATEVNGSPIS